MGDAREHAGEGLEPRVLEAVAVDEPGPRRRPDAHEVRLWVTGASLPRDRLRRDGAEAEPHRAPEDARVVVHRRQDERVRQAHAAERHRKPRILEAERTEAVERNQPERRLAERDRRRLRETAEDAVVEEPVEGREGSRHAETARE